MLSIRPVIQQDLPSLAWSEDAKELTEFNEEQFRYAQMGYLSFLIAELGGEIVGRIRFTVNRSENSAWIFGLQVKPSIRNKGIGTRLMKAAESALQTDGCEKVYLTVTIENKDALRLYQQLGYTIIKQGVQQWSYPKQEKRIEVTEKVFFMVKPLNKTSTQTPISSAEIS